MWCRKARASGCASAPSAAPRAAWKTATTCSTKKFPPFLHEVGETNIVSTQVVTYEQFDVGIQKIMTDYGLLVIYSG